MFSSSDEPEGPPNATLDLSGATDLGLGDNELAAVSLPFDFTWYGTTYSSAEISSNGVLFFEGADSAAVGACPGTSGTWSGVAAFWNDFGPGQVRTATFGRYPRRAYAVDWLAPDALAGGDGHVQLWLLEARPEAVVVLNDLTFSDASGITGADGGARASVGAQGGSGTGLGWACSGGLTDETSAWFGQQGDRPGAAERAHSELDAWSGTSDFQYAGRTLAGADLQGDGFGDAVVGDQDQGMVYVVVGGPSRGTGALSDADSSFEGNTGDSFGAALATGDLDADGLQEIYIGAPGNDSGASDAGAVYGVAAGALETSYALSADADLVLLGSSGLGKPNAGTSIATGDVDGDGADDLVIGAPKADNPSSDQGVVYLWYGGSASGSSGLSSADGRWTGASAQDQLGRAVAVLDLDGDGAAEIAASAPYFDGLSAGSTVSNAGRVYVIPGASYAGAAAITAVATASVTGSTADDRLGMAVALGDFNSDGSGDLVAGAPYVDTVGSDAGAAYIFGAIFATTGDVSAGAATTTISGGSSSANLGSTFATGDLDGDGRTDLVVGAPNDSTGAASAGAAAVYTDLPAGALAFTDADHLLVGDTASAAVATALVVIPDHQGDGAPDLLSGAPYADASTGETRAGQVTIWSFVPDFQDDDGDGFVAATAGGLDCDDADPDVWPGNPEAADNGLDEDCDGWVDGAVVVRSDEDGWTWDVEAELGVSAADGYGFESATAGDDPTDTYADDGIGLDSDGDLTVATSAWGALPVGALGVRVLAGTDDNDVTFSLAGGVDALALQVLDGDAAFELYAWSDGEPVCSGVPFTAPGANRTGGVFAGFTFARSVDEIQIIGGAGDPWGLDDLQIVWAADTDRDLDGYTDAAGDCDDDNIDVHPDADEDLTNGVDDDCDGIVDGGGASVLTDVSAFDTALGLTADIVDFEDVAVGLDITDDYDDLGVIFDGDLVASADIDGSAPRDAVAAEAGSSITLTFEELQPAVGLYLLDLGGAVSVQGEADGEVLYSLVVSAIADDTDGGSFVGLVFDYGVDTLTLTAVKPLETWGIDDVMISPLGQVDDDGDGLTELEGDCDDHDSAVLPGASETWYDGVDQDCDGQSDYDADGDGHDVSGAGGLDCDDASDAISPDADEIWYDGIDEDCDGWSDYDADQDGHDDEDWGGDDCDDTEETTNPEADEVYYDGVDADCDGQSDYDADKDGFVPSAYGGFIVGDDTVTTGDCDDEAAATNPDADEVYYDGVDSDCDGQSDLDADGDGYDSDLWGGDDCDDGDEYTYPDSTHEICYDGEDSACDGGDDFDCDGDGYALEGYGGEDCDDENASIYPGARETPRDGVDSDCDDALEFDDDRDGYDDEADGGDDCDDSNPTIHPDATDTCYDGRDQDCAGNSDYDCDGDSHLSAGFGGDDCDDADGTIYPDATDYWYDDIDNNCDGAVDFDADADGALSDWYGGTDCDDTDATIGPTKTETWYDGVDQDCDGDNDYDQDGDGALDPSGGGDDCDDTNPGVRPGATEAAGDGVDQDCDGIDDIDIDGDGVLSADDCDDHDALSYPGADEICNDSRDQDCDGADVTDCDADGADGDLSGGEDCNDNDADVHPGADDVWYDGVDSDCSRNNDYDQDADGYSVELWGGTDCNDVNFGVNPGVPEDSCVLGDEDCDGLVDEDCNPSSDSGTGDSGTGDSGGADSSSTPGDSGGDSGADDSTAPTDSGGGDEGGDEGGGIVPTDDGCGCSAGPRSAPGLAGLVLGLALLARRRR